MAEAIKQASGVEPRLIRSGGGVFEVRVDGEVIFSKQKSHRFPEAAEIIDTLRQRRP